MNHRFKLNRRRKLTPPATDLKRQAFAPGAIDTTKYKRRNAAVKIGLFLAVIAAAIVASTYLSIVVLDTIFNKL